MTEKFSLKGFLIDLDGVLTAGDYVVQLAFDAVEERRRREIQFRVITNTTIRDRFRFTEENLRRFRSANADLIPDW